MLGQHDASGVIQKMSLLSHQSLMQINIIRYTIVELISKLHI